MKKLKRNPAKFEVLDLYNAVASQEGYSLKDPDSANLFIKKIEQELSNARSTPIVLYGLQAQSMFSYVAACLENCALIKTEDSGEIYAQDDNLTVPDFRIVLVDGTELLVEVKNYSQTLKKAMESYKIKKKYLEGLKIYASLFKKELKIAIYWSSWNVWTLVSHDKFQPKKNDYVLALTDALVYDEMMLLGDHRLATTPPIEMRLVADPSKMRTVNPDGPSFFRVGDVEMMCAGKTIVDEQERAIAFRLMMYSKWDVKELVETTDDQLDAMVFSANPLEPVENQEFQFLGSMSEILSREYLALTSPEGTIERISPKMQGLKFDMRIPLNYQGKSLRLWRFFSQTEVP